MVVSRWVWQWDVLFATIRVNMLVVNRVSKSSQVPGTKKTHTENSVMDVWFNKFPLGFIDLNSFRFYTAEKGA